MREGHTAPRTAPSNGDARQAFRIDARRGPASNEPTEADLNLPLALLFAFLGGLVLNLMPCVFPVLAIKALGLAQQGGRHWRHRLGHGLAYSGGVLAFFALVAVGLAALRAGGAAVGWGFQLQSPTFVALMAYLFVALGQSLAGAVTIGTQLMGIGGAARGSGLRHRWKRRACYRTVHSPAHGRRPRLRADRDADAGVRDGPALPAFEPLPGPRATPAAGRPLDGTAQVTAGLSDVRDGRLAGLASRSSRPLRGLMVAP